MFRVIFDVRLVLAGPPPLPPPPPRGLQLGEPAGAIYLARVLKLLSESPIRQSLVEEKATPSVMSKRGSSPYRFIAPSHVPAKRPLSTVSGRTII
jgi:hypothetical protein